MKFHFEFDINRHPVPIDHTNDLFLIGSCFTENIGEKLRKYKFNVLENPNGILFNPVSVAEAITAYVDNKQVSEDDLFYLNEGWHSWKHHSRYSAIEKGEAVKKINASTQRAHEYLKKASHVMITLGSSWIYTFTDKAANAQPGRVAANNHKAPADWFHRKLMTVEEVLSVLDNMVHRLFFNNRDVQIIFTISPVRHLREGVVENNRSKAVLINAVHHLADKFNNIYYFPAYELVIDDLRDYRFYAEDLVHPNYHATQYVWEKFVKACMKDASIRLMQEIQSINLAFQHKPFNPASEQHKKFLQTFLEKTKVLQMEHPEMDLQKEIAYFSGEKD